MAHHHGGFGHHHHHGGFGHHHHVHHGFFGHHGHHGFGHHHRHHGPGLGFGPGPAVGALAAGALAGAAVATVAARAQPAPSVPYGTTGIAVSSAPAYAIPNCAVIAPPMVPPLGISSVRIPAELIESSGGVTWFTIEAFPDNGGAPFRTRHRYNQFHDLADQLGQRSRNILSAPFPRKHLTGCEGAKLEARRAALEAWLLQVIRYSNSYDHADWRLSLQSFLQIPVSGTIQNLGVPLVNRANPTASIGIAAAIPVAAPVPVAATVSSPTASVGGARFPAELSPTASLGAAALPSVAPASSVLPPLPPPSEPAPVASSGPAASDCCVMEIEVPAGVDPGQHIGVAVPSGETLLFKVPDGAVAGQTLSLWYENGTLRPLM